MKKDSFLINVSRGEVINELDLTKALKNKIIAGAALDVLSNENSFNPKKNILINYARKNNNLIITSSYRRSYD
jgi:lactate dehydrogenase-like 2-hydroxyacid dehydrogenase